MKKIIAALRPRWREFKLSIYLLNRNLLTRAAIIMVLLLVVLAVIAPLIIPYPGHVENENDPANMLQAPSGEHWFGTDELGRDVFSRVLYGTRISLRVSVIAVAIAVVFGMMLGAIAGAAGGIIDEVIMRITDIFLSFPSLLLAIAISAFLGPSLTNAMLAIAVSWWPWYTRIVRGQAVSIRERQFVRAARAMGTPGHMIVFKHIIPNTIAQVIVQASMDIGGVIMTLSSLSFLGLGAQAPTPEWGLMINTGRTYFQTAWWYSIFPGIAIFLTVLSFNLVGDGLREVLDPKTRKL
ncbi:MAG: nickel transporter permease [Clostridiaceae bacterium]|nr:ABC transporter permease [Eubacteriales bacterium]